MSLIDQISKDLRIVFTKQEVFAYLEELATASEVFVGRRTAQSFYNIVLNLMNETKYIEYKIEFYKMTVRSEHRFYDLCLLASAWRDVASWSNKKNIESAAQIDMNVKTGTMQFIAQITERLMFHQYSTINKTL